MCECDERLLTFLVQTYVYTEDTPLSRETTHPYTYTHARAHKNSHSYLPHTHAHSHTHTRTHTYISGRVSAPEAGSGGFARGTSAPRGGYSAERGGGEGESSRRERATQTSQRCRSSGMHLCVPVCVVCMCDRFFSCLPLVIIFLPHINIHTCVRIIRASNHT